MVGEEILLLHFAGGNLHRERLVNREPAAADPDLDGRVDGEGVIVGDDHHHHGALPCDQAIRSGHHLDQIEIHQGEIVLRYRASVFGSNAKRDYGPLVTRPAGNNGVQPLRRAIEVSGQRERTQIELEIEVVFARQRIDIDVVVVERESGIPFPDVDPDRHSDARHGLFEHALARPRCLPEGSIGFGNLRQVERFAVDRHEPIDVRMVVVERNEVVVSLQVGVRLHRDDLYDDNAGRPTLPGGEAFGAGSGSGMRHARPPFTTGRRTVSRQTYFAAGQTVPWSIFVTGPRPL